MVYFFFGSSARSVTSEDEDDDFLFSNERDVGDEVVMSWAKVTDFFIYVIIYIDLGLVDC